MIFKLREVGLKARKHRACGKIQKKIKTVRCVIIKLKNTKYVLMSNIIQVNVIDKLPYKNMYCLYLPKKKRQNYMHRQQIHLRQMNKNIQSKRRTKKPGKCHYKESRHLYR